MKIQQLKKIATKPFTWIIFIIILGIFIVQIYHAINFTHRKDIEKAMAETGKRTNYTVSLDIPSGQDSTVISTKTTGDQTQINIKSATFLTTVGQINVTGDKIEIANSQNVRIDGGNLAAAVYGRAVKNLVEPLFYLQSGQKGGYWGKDNSDGRNNRVYQVTLVNSELTQAVNDVMKSYGIENKNAVTLYIYIDIKTNLVNKVDVYSGSGDAYRLLYKLKVSYD